MMMLYSHGLDCGEGGGQTVDSAVRQCSQPREAKHTRTHTHTHTPWPCQCQVKLQRTTVPSTLPCADLCAELGALTHKFKDEVNVFIIPCSDHIQKFDNVGMISKLLRREQESFLNDRNHTNTHRSPTSAAVRPLAAIVSTLCKQQ